MTMIANFLRHQLALKAIRKSGIWFVDIPRTSSSSIRTELSQHFHPAFGKSDLTDPRFNLKIQGIPSHLTATEMRQALGNKSWKNLFTFTLVRNPWDRMWSLFNYRKQVNELPSNRSFDQYLNFFYNLPESNESPFGYSGYHLQSADYLVDQHGKIIVDFVGRYETRKHDLLYVSERCNCPGLGKLHLQSSANPLSYREHYNAKTKAMVSELCQKDIELFDYQF